MYRDDKSMGPGIGRQPSAPSPQLGPVFFTFKPEPPDAAETDRGSQKLRDPHGLTGNPLTWDRLHMTLLYLGTLPDLQRAILDRACDIAAGISWRPFDITFDRVMTLRNPASKHPFTLIARDGNAALLLFQRELVKTMRNAGLIRGKPRFTPHVTLVWDYALVRETPLDATMTWTVREFQLIFSIVGQSRHECLGRWPFKG